MSINCVSIGPWNMFELDGTSLKARHDRRSTGGTVVLRLRCTRASLKQLVFGPDFDILVGTTLGKFEAISRSKNQQLEKERGSSTTTGLYVKFQISTLHLHRRWSERSPYLVCGGSEAQKRLRILF